MEAFLGSDTELQSLVRHLSRLGIETYVAGGAIRDLLLDLTPTDFDLVCRPRNVDHLLLALRALPGHLDTSSSALGVFTHHASSGRAFEIALPRLARSPSLAYSEFKVAFSCSLPIEEDLTRRDFNVNALAWDCQRSLLIDPTHGLASLAQGSFAALPSRSLREDAVKSLRALVLCARCDLQPDAACATILAEAARGLPTLPSHRVRREFLRVTAAPHAAKAFRLAHELGILAILLPAMESAFDFDQHNRHHHQSLGEHSLAVLEVLCARDADLSLRLAGLLHDLGKPGSAVWSGRQMHFPGHAQAGSKLAEDALTRWDLDDALVEEVSLLVAEHMFATPSTPSSLPGPQSHTRRLLLLRIADMESKGQDITFWEGWLESLGVQVGREAFMQALPTHLPSRVHPWAEHRNRKRRGNWDERAQGRKPKSRFTRRDRWAED